MSSRRLFYGWVLVACAMLITMVSYMMRYSFATFYPFILTDMGWSRPETMAAFMVHMYMYGCFTILTGLLTDRIGPRWTICILGGIFWPLGYFLIGYSANSPAMFILFYGVICAIGASACYVPTMGIATKWFIKHRGMAVGIVSLGVGLGWCLSRIAGYYCIIGEWRKGFMVMAVIGGVILWTAGFVMRRSPEDMGLKPLSAEEPNPNPNSGKRKRRPPYFLFLLAGFRDILALAAIFSKGRVHKLFYMSMGSGMEVEPPKKMRNSWFRRFRKAEMTPVEFTHKEAVRTWRFWMIFTMYFFGLIGLYGILKNAAAYSILEVGIPKTVVAAWFGILIGTVSMPGRFFGGVISDYIGRRIVLTTSFIIGIIDIILWIVMAPTVWWFIGCTALLAFSYGTWAPLVPAMIADTFGREASAGLFGLVTLAAGIGGGLGAELPTLVPTYKIGFIYSIVGYVVAILFCWFIKPPTPTHNFISSQDRDQIL